MIYVFVGAAGIAGALLRYGIGAAAGAWWDHSFPGTLIINMLGCLALGLFLARVPANSLWKATIGSGLIGSFTTFSTFSVETVKLAQEGRAALACGYAFASLAGGLLAAWVGSRLGSAFRRGAQPAPESGRGSGAGEEGAR